MHVAIERRDGIEFLTVTGRIDKHTSREFEDALTDAAKKAEHGVVIDLRAVEYLSASGLRAILMGVRALKARECRFAAFGPSEFVTFRGVEDILPPIMETEEEAIKVVMG